MQGIIPVESNAKGQECEHGHSKIRVWYEGAAKNKPAHYIFKCGCCNAAMTMMLTPGCININGIKTSPEEWSRVLFPVFAMASSMAVRRDQFKELRSNLRMRSDQFVVDATGVDIFDLSDKLTALLAKEYKVVLPDFEMTFLARIIVDMNNAFIDIRSQKAEEACEMSNVENT